MFKYMKLYKFIYINTQQFNSIPYSTCKLTLTQNRCTLILQYNNAFTLFLRKLSVKALL